MEDQNHQPADETVPEDCTEDHEREAEDIIRNGIPARLVQGPTGETLIVRE